MAIALDPLPFEYNALEPHVSEETMQFHHDKHHKKYVDTLNGLIAGTSFENMALPEIIAATAPKNTPAQFAVYDQDDEDGLSPDSDALRQMIFDNAAQAWNHGFYWQCIKPGGADIPADLKKALNDSFGSVDAFKKQFRKAAGEQFGSGWAWLVAGPNGLGIVKTGNADTPLAHKLTPLLTVDVWEHAYYLDYQNKRPDYLDVFTNKLINWNFVARNWQATTHGANAA